MNIVITLGATAVMLARHIVDMEDSSLFDNQVSRESRVIGVLGEMAAAEYLRGTHGNQRSIVPMGLAARTGSGFNAYGMGDILAVRNGSPKFKMKEVLTFEVKARTAGAGKGHIIRCDSAENCADNDINRVIFVEVEHKGREAECRIVGYFQPLEILEWEQVVNGTGQECYIMPA